MGNVPFRYDFVGSFLRPQALKDAKEALDNGKLSQEDYDHIVDEEVVKVVKKQKELGYHVITDGEFRRTFWHLDFMWGFEGVEHKNTGNGVRFNGGFKTIRENGAYNTYYFQKNGQAKKGWLRLNGKKYYFYPSGDKAGVCAKNTKIRTASGMIYVFDKNGVYVRRYKRK